MTGQDLLGLMSMRGRQAVKRRKRYGTDDRHEGMLGGLCIVLVGDPCNYRQLGSHQCGRTSRPLQVAP